MLSFVACCKHLFLTCLVLNRMTDVTPPVDKSWLNDLYNYSTVFSYLTCKSSESLSLDSIQTKNVLSQEKWIKIIGMVWWTHLVVLKMWLFYSLVYHETRYWPMPSSHTSAHICAFMSTHTPFFFSPLCLCFSLVGLTSLYPPLSLRLISVLLCSLTFCFAVTFHLRAWLILLNKL